jgi:hypothetical protein
MTVLRSARFAAVALVLSAAAMAATASAWQQMPPMPTPGPEHDVLKTEVGTWDAVVEMTPAPGAPVMKSTGVEVNTIGCGGLCLITEFKADMMGTTFEGHGIATWDPAKKKYVGTWMDSMSTGLATSESTYDPAAKKWTGWMEGPDMTGKVVRSRSVVAFRDANTRVFTMYSTGPDGKEVEGLKITYTKR